MKKQHRSFTLYDGIPLGITSLSVFILLALASYHESDPSLFHVYSYPHAIENWCGTCGAHCSALLRWLFGTAAYSIPFVGIFLCLRDRKKYSWGLYSALYLLICACAALCVLHNASKDTLQRLYSGGFIGFHIAHILTRSFDAIGSFIILYTFCSLVILVAAESSLHDSLLFIRRIIGLTIKTIFFILHRLYDCMIFILAAGYGRVFKKQIAPTPLIQYAQTTQIHTMQPEAALCVPDRDNPPVHVKQIKNQGSYTLPSLDLLALIPIEKESAAAKKEIESLVTVLEEKLQRFNIRGSVVSIKRGPVVTLFEYQPDSDTKLSKIVALEDDLAMALHALSVRILAPIPGRSVVGFEVAHGRRQEVSFATLLRTIPEWKTRYALPLILGVDTTGEGVVVDLVTMPHLLIAGSTGSGKSVALNTMLMSILYARSPDDMKLILIDPKRLEFATYAELPHLIFPIITDSQRAIQALTWVVDEMNRRYECMAQENVRSIDSYNKTRGTNHDKLALIVVIIDELADLMMTAGRDVEDLITRIAQMARAAGIYMIVATQRPSVDVITGIIKVNFPSRISFRLTSKIDSRTILDSNGAEKLLGKGDMLFIDSQSAFLRRIHGAYVSSDDIESVTDFIRHQREFTGQELSAGAPDDHMLDSTDKQLFTTIIDYLNTVDEISTSSLQRKFRLGYNRAARMIELLEKQGRILPASSGKMRKVLK